MNSLLHASLSPKKLCVHACADCGSIVSMVVVLGVVHFHSMRHLLPKLLTCGHRLTSTVLRRKSESTTPVPTPSARYTRSATTKCDICQPGRVLPPGANPGNPKNCRRWSTILTRYAQESESFILNHVNFHNFGLLFDSGQIRNQMTKDAKKASKLETKHKIRTAGYAKHNQRLRQVTTLQKITSN